MTTEREGTPTDSTVETINLDIDPALDTVAAPEAPTETFEPEVGIEGGDIETSEGTTDTQSTNTVFQSPEFKKYQSSTDKRMAELETQLTNERVQRDRYQEQESQKNLEAEVGQYSQELREKYLNQGIDDVSAQQMAQDQAALARDAYVSKMQVDRMTRQNQQVSSELNNRTQLARAYELASQHNIPFTELQEITNPVEMERHAKSLKRIKDLESRLQGATPSQTYGSGTPAVDVAPTNASNVLDKYNAGDPAVSTDMARAAARQMGLTIFD
jgi:hypothetical protein